MARPAKRRIICGVPLENEFGPLHSPRKNRETIIMQLDEFETIRLIDFERLTQEECALQMNVARTTIQGIYESARMKLASSLVEGKRIVIQGGTYDFCKDAKDGCQNGHCHRFGHYNKNKEKRTYMIIALPVQSQEIPLKLNSTLGRSPWFYLYNTSTKTGEFITNTAAQLSGGAGIKAAQLLLDHNIDVLITPRSGTNALDVFKEANVKVYESASTDVLENIVLFDENKLNSILEGQPGFHHA